MFDPADTGLMELMLRKNTREGEVGLMLAVLGDALEYYQKYAMAKDARGKRLFGEAEEWIFETNSEWLFSFENICEVLHLDPDFIRKSLLLWKQTADQKPYEAKRRFQQVS